MGSFDVGCGLSNLAIHYGDKTGFLIIDKAREYSRQGRIKPGGRNFNVYSTDKYLPYLPPVFGEYDDYGRITNIRDTTSARLIEAVFDRPVEVVLNCIGADRDIYSTSGGIYENYILPEHKIKNPYGSDEIEKFLNLGFTHEPNSANGEATFSYGGFALLEKGHNLWEVIDLKDGTVVGDQISASYDSEVWHGFGERTGLWPGFDESHWQIIQDLHRLSGMFFLEDVFHGIVDATKNDYFVKQANKEFAGDYADWAKKYEVIPGEDENMKFFRQMSGRDNSVGRFLERLCSFPTPNLEVFTIYKDDIEDLRQMFDFVSVTVSINRMIQPSYCGEQDGNDKASAALNTLTDAILSKRVKDRAEWDYDEDEDIDDESEAEVTV